MPLITVEKTKKYFIINKAIKQGLNDIKAGRTFGPFQSVHEFKQALRKN